jgi:serine/threonine protein kinase
MHGTLPPKMNGRRVADRDVDPFGGTESEVVRSGDLTIPAGAQAASVITPAMLAPGIHAGRYEIIGRLGAGSMGIVFEARDDELDRTVALKLVHSGVRDGELAQARLRQEAQAMARLSHANVVSVFDIGMFGDQLFIAMELVRGQTLRDLVGSNLPWRDILVLAIAAGRGLAAAHEAGVVHRDFKPDNVLVRADGAVRVSDFGLARAVEGGTTTTDGELAAHTEVAGTPAYMSPESFDGIADALTDQYAFAVTMYELLEGKRPFAGRGGAVERRDGVRVASDSPRSWQRREIPSAVRVAIERGFAAERAARWPSVAEFCAVVERSVRRRTRAQMVAIVVAGVVAGAAIAITANPRAPTPTPNSAPTFANATQQQLTFSGEASMPNLTRDGQQLAYIEGLDRNAFVVRNLTLGQAKIFHQGLGSRSIFSVQWSPDGTNILIQNESGTSLMPSNGRERRSLRVHGFASWSPDGLEIVSSLQPEATPLHVTDVHTSATRSSALTLPGMRWRQVFSWPFADRVLIFSMMQGHGNVIWSVRPDGTDARKIYEDERSTLAGHPLWVASGRAIYYQRLRDQTTEIVRLALDDAGNIGDERVVFSPPTFSMGFSVSDNERSLVYSRTNESTTVAVTSGGRRTVIPTDARPKQSLSVSPDGRTIAFIASVGERGQLIVAPRDGGTKTLQMVEGRPLALAWSPHGDRLAYTVATTTGVQLWTVELATGAERRMRTSALSEGGEVAWTARDEILFQTDGNRNYGVLAPGKPERALIADDTMGWMFQIEPSPDGRRAAVFWNRRAPPDASLRSEVQGAWVISLDDGTAAQIWTQRMAPIGWSDDGAWVFLVDGAKAKSGRVLAVDASGTGRSRVVLDESLPFGTDLRMLPGGEGFAAIEPLWHSDLWLVSLDRRRIDVSSVPVPSTAALVTRPTPHNRP